MKRIFSLILSLVMVLVLMPSAIAEDLQEDFSSQTLENDLSFDSPAPIGLADAETAESIAFSPAGNNPIISDELIGVGSTKLYTVEIDHSITPEAIVCAYSDGIPCDFDMVIHRGDTQTSATLEIRNTASSDSNFYYPKMYGSLKMKEAPVVTYQFEIRAKSEHTCFAFRLGSPDTFVDDCDIVTTVAKNVPTPEVAAVDSTGLIEGRQILLNSGEWYHYIADGDTYITAVISRYNNLAFEVKEMDTDRIVCTTTADDRVRTDLSSTLFEGLVQKKLSLEKGKSYLIRFYCTSTITPNSIWDKYNIYIGLPSFSNATYSYASPSSYSVSANVARTFTFNVSNFPKSAIAGNFTQVSFKTGKRTDNTYISSCEITAPNGYKFLAPQGSYSKFGHPDLINYGNSLTNIPLNGTWQVTIKARKALSGLTFRIGGKVIVIDGKGGN